ncbi:condensation domain-containing protein [Streptomyces qinglanensis]|uniref:condensation domain-containing protein n=1 Tax=Streptomyces qinglanensis TaxID=943816 RepID=UPI00379224C0
MPQTASGDTASELAETTRVLLGLIREELGEDAVSEDDDFYAVGGDSLIAVRIVARANDLGIGIRLIDLLSHPSAAELAACRPAPAAAADPGGASPPAPPPAPPPLPQSAVRRPASSLQVGLVYQCEMSEDPALYNDLIGVRVHGPFDEGCLRTALAALLDRHPALRSSFDLAAEPGPVQVLHPRLPLPLEVDRPVPDVSGGAAAEGAAVAAADAWRARQLRTPFDWQQPPLFRCHAACAAPAGEAFRLTVAMHHALMDGWSFATLVTELLRLYDAAVEDVPPSLPPLPSGVHERFVAAEQAALSSTEAAEFWRRHAEGPRLLPHRVRHALPGDASARLDLPFDRSLGTGLRAAAAQAGTPLKSLLLAVHSWALAHWSGHPEGGIATGIVLNGRPELAGAEGEVGLFLNTVPVRLPAADGSWQERARAARDVEAEAAPHRHYPLAAVEEHLGRPAFDVAFNFTDFRVYRHLAELRRIRVDEWFHADKADHPVSCDYTLDFPGFGTGLLVSYDPDLIPEPRLRAFAALVAEGLCSAARDPAAPPPATGAATAAGGGL